MFVLWGFGRRSNYTGELVKDICGGCGTTQNMNILTEYNYGSIFFVPIIKLNRKYYIVCPRCGAGKQISKSEFKAIKAANRRGLIYEPQDVVVKKEEKTLIENVSKIEEPKNLEADIIAEIDSLVKLLKEKNYVITPEKHDKFKIVLKEQLKKKFNDEKMIDEAIDKYLKNMK